MQLIDTHSHIYSTDFDNDRPEMLEKAWAAQVGLIFMPAIDSTTHGAMLAAEKNNPERCLSMMGLHPCSVKENYKEELRIARDHLEKRKFIAIGETGLDFYWDLTFTAQQYEAFHLQAQWALEYDIPIVIHSRNSTDECIKVIAEHQQGKLKGVFHCFSGSTEQAQQIMDLGFYMGIGGVVTFKNSGLDKVIGAIGLDQCVLETDAPYLAPMPFRGKRNEPAYLSYVVKKLAEITGKSEEEVAEITSGNARKLFSIK